MSQALPESAHDRLDDLYDEWLEDDGARHCGELPDEACREVPASFFLYVASLVLTKLGDALANPKTTLTWVMGAVGAPAGLTALLVPIRESGSMLPQIFLGGLVRRQPIRKWTWVVGSVLQAFSILAMGAAAAFASGRSAGLLILGAVILFSLSRSLSSVASKDVKGKTLPKGRRGRASGLAASIAGGLTMAVALALLAVRQDADPRLYGLGLAMAAGLWLLAAGLFSRIGEQPGETGGGAGLSEAFERLGLLARDADFRRFVITWALFVSTALAGPYYVMLAQERAGGKLSLLALFVLANGLSSSLSSLLWGRFADRSSRRTMLAGATLASLVGVATFAVARLAPGWLSHAAVPVGLFFVLGLGYSGVRMGRKTFVVDLAGGNRRTDYVATGNTVIGALLLASSALGGLVGTVGADGMLLLLAFCGFAGMAWGRGLPEVE